MNVNKNLIRSFFNNTTNKANTVNVTLFEESEFISVVICDILLINKTKMLEMFE